MASGTAARFTDLANFYGKSIGGSYCFIVSC